MVCGLIEEETTYLGSKKQRQLFFSRSKARAAVKKRERLVFSWSDNNIVQPDNTILIDVISLCVYIIDETEYQLQLILKTTDPLQTIQIP